MSSRLSSDIAYLAANAVDLPPGDRHLVTNGHCYGYWFESTDSDKLIHDLGLWPEVGMIFEVARSRGYRLSLQAKFSLQQGGKWLTKFSHFSRNTIHVVGKGYLGVADLATVLDKPDQRVGGLLDGVQSPGGCYLASVLSRPMAGRIAARDIYRRYRSTVRTESVIGAVADHRVTSIFYEVGRRYGDAAACLAQVPQAVPRVDATFSVNTALSEEFAGFARKYSNFSADFTHASFAGMVQRLAAGLAAQSVYGGLTSTSLRGGADLNIQVLGTLDGPMNSLVASVFIPRLVTTAIDGDVFAVLANAAAGEGSSVVTDVLNLDAATRQPIMGVVPTEQLPHAIVSALRILGANMVASNQGPLFALAVTRGLHRVLTVVGHTDEGGIMRDLLRCGAMAPAFGGIQYSLAQYNGIPSLPTGSAIDVAAYCDAIALQTAALTAHCDPGLVRNGQWFPTVIYGGNSTDAHQSPGGHTEGLARHGASIRSQLITTAGPFWQLYIGALGKLFCAEGDTALAVSVQSANSHRLDDDPRHLRHISVAPWYWIEPTSLLPPGFLGSAAEAGGSGSFAPGGGTAVRDAWEGIEQVQGGDVAYASYIADFLSPRRSWFFAHWLGHTENGLGAIRIRQADPEGFIHPGHCDAAEPVADRIIGSLPLTDFLWVRGQSPFCAPGELINTGGTIGFTVRHVSYDDEGNPDFEHVPLSSEFVNTTVTVGASRPVGLAPAGSNVGDRQARRARTNATTALAAALKRAMIYGRSDVSDLPILLSAPKALGTRVHPAPDEFSGGPAALGPTSGRGVGPPPAGQPQGEPVPAVGQYAPQRYPQVVNRGGGVQGAGAARPPPGGAAGGGGGGAAPPPGGGGDDEGGADAAPGPDLPPPIQGAAPPGGPAVNV